MRLVDLAAAVIARRTPIRPAIGVVLGSGLGAFAKELNDATGIPYGEITGWPASTAVGHAGELVIGYLRGIPVAVMNGRAHLYEGHPVDKVVFGVRTLVSMGVRKLIFTNAAGGINLSYSRGGLVLIKDHINLQGVNPLTGPNDDALGPRFPDMTDAYDPALRAVAHRAAAGIGIELTEGVYAALPGPSYETPAEIRFLRTIGADLVGMSTVPEVIAARHAGVRCLAISCVTNMAAGILPQKINHDEVLETGAGVRNTLVSLLGRIIPEAATR
jgi:purine-nucleoside phosphorylase